jgi:putative FmdB family regulatory protein
MPTYEYQCEKGHEFTLEQRIADPAIEICKCGKKCKRLISRSSFHLRGPGWAKDGYSSSGGGKKKGK